MSYNLALLPGSAPAPPPYHSTPGQMQHSHPSSYQGEPPPMQNHPYAQQPSGMYNLPPADRVNSGSLPPRGTVTELPSWYKEITQKELIKQLNDYLKQELEIVQKMNATSSAYFKLPLKNRKKREATPWCTLNEFSSNYMKEVWFEIGLWFGLSGMDPQFRCDNPKACEWKPSGAEKGGITAWIENGQEMIDVKGKPAICAALLVVIVCVVNGIDPRLARHCKVVEERANATKDSQYLGLKVGERFTVFYREIEKLDLDFAGVGSIIPFSLAEPRDHLRVTANYAYSQACLVEQERQQARPPPNFAPPNMYIQSAASQPQAWRQPEPVRMPIQQAQVQPQIQEQVQQMSRIPIQEQQQQVPHIPIPKQQPPIIPQQQASQPPPIPKQNPTPAQPAQDEDEAEQCFTFLQDHDEMRANGIDPNRITSEDVSEPCHEFDLGKIEANDIIPDNMVCIGKGSIGWSVVKDVEVLEHGGEGEETVLLVTLHKLITPHEAKIVNSSEFGAQDIEDSDIEAYINDNLEKGRLSVNEKLTVMKYLADGLALIRYDDEDGNLYFSPIPSNLVRPVDQLEVLARASAVIVSSGKDNFCSFYPSRFTGKEPLFN